MVPAHQKLTQSVYGINLPFRLSHKEKQVLKHHHKRAEITIAVAPPLASCTLTPSTQNVTLSPPDFSSQQATITSSCLGNLQFDKMIITANCGLTVRYFPTLGKASGTCDEPTLQKALLNLTYLAPGDPRSLGANVIAPITSTGAVHLEIAAQDPSTSGGMGSLTGTLTGTIHLRFTPSGPPH